MYFEITLAPADGSEEDPISREFLLRVAELMQAKKASLKLDIDDADMQSFWLMLINTGRVTCVVEVPSEDH